MNPFQMSLVPDTHVHGALILAVARQAADRLDLQTHLRSMTLIVDEIFSDDQAWFECCRDGDADIYCHQDNFQLRSPEIHSMMPSLLPWEFKSEALPVEKIDAPFSRLQCERFLYHQFLALRDIRDGSIAAALVPEPLAEAFQQAWAVCIDGRLRRLSLPGLGVAERRRIFYRIFSEGGVLLPSHWDIFHELWECESPDCDRLLKWVGRLPALRSGLLRQE